MVIYTAIFGNHDTLKEPIIITPGWKYICFTDQELKSDVWEIRNVRCWSDSQRCARYYKILFYDSLCENGDYTIWVDASFTINYDLNHWWMRYGSEFTVINHPERNCIYDEAEVCKRMMKCDPELMDSQTNHYRSIGVPMNFGLIQSGILMRKCTKRNLRFCIEWYNEVMNWTARDQVSFAKVHNNRPNTPIKKIDWHYRQSDEFIFTPHKSAYDRIKRL